MLMMRPKKIKDDIDSEEYWKSDSQKTMAAFLDLLTQYHKDFIKGDNAPLGKAVDQLKALQTALGSFYEDWDAHTELETIE